MRSLAITAALLLAPAAAQAESVGLRQCLATIDMHAMANSQRLACATTDMDRADHALNATYRKVKARLSPARRTKLVVAERAWIARRHDACALERMEPLPTRDYNRMTCLVDRTDARTAQLGDVR